MKKTVDSVLGRTEVRIGPEPAAMWRVSGRATAGRAPSRSADTTTMRGTKEGIEGLKQRTQGHTISSVRPAFNTPPCYEPRGEEAQERGREEEPVEPVWSESAVHGTGASILDPTASSIASEPIEASEAGELAGTEEVESAISCETAPSVAGDTAEARAAVKPRIEPSAAGELAGARAAGEPAEACAAGSADAASKLTGASAAGAAVGLAEASAAARAVASAAGAGASGEQAVGASPSATASSGQAEDVSQNAAESSEQAEGP